MRENADGIVVRIVSVDGAAAEIIVVAGLKAVAAGHFQRFVQHLAASRSKRFFRVLLVHDADAANAADLGDIVDEFLPMVRSPLVYLAVKLFPIHGDHPSFLIISNTFRPIQSAPEHIPAY